MPLPLFCPCRFLCQLPSAHQRAMAVSGDLCQRIQCQKAKGYPFAEATVMNWFVQLCQALDCLHQKRILHRDLKAENVLLTVAGAVKLADFGVSVQLQV